MLIGKNWFYVLHFPIKKIRQELKMDSTYDSQSRLERIGLSISTSHSNQPTKTHEMFILLFYFYKVFVDQYFVTRECENIGISQ